MAVQNKITLKSFFQTGDIPTEDQYADLIDSSLIVNDNNTGNIQLAGDIIVTGDISASGQINTLSHITASGNISASGTLIANKIILDGGSVTSPSYTFAEDSDTGISSPSANTININAGGNTGEISITENKVSIHGAQVGDASFNVSGHVTASGNISSSGNVLASLGTGSFSKLETTNIKLGGTEITSTAAEINFLDGVLSNVKEAYDTVAYNGTTGVLTFTELDNGTDTIDLGVGSTDTPTFAGLTITKVDKGGLGTYGDVLESVGQSTTFTITGIPTIPGRASNKVSKPAPTFIRNNVVTADSVILVTCTTDELSAVGFGNNTPTAIDNRGFFLNIGNESAFDFTTTSASFSAIIL